MLKAMSSRAVPGVGRAAVVAAVAGVALLPLLLAFSTGPGPFRTGAPGDSGHCAAGSCHVGAAARGEGIQLQFPNGPYYRPGVTQRIRLVVTGASGEPERAVFGFQLSPRLGIGSGAGGEAGGQLAATDARVWVQCADGNLKLAQGCAGGAAVEFAQHRRPSVEPWWEVEWTPPAEAADAIEFYAAANAANGSGDNFGDRIYLRSFRVLPAGPLTVRQPFGGAGASPGAWLEIYAAGGAPGFAQGLAPEGSEASTVVRVGGREARVAYAGPGQVNVLLANDTSLGEQTLELRSATARLDSPIWIAGASPSVYPVLPEVAAGRVAVVYATGCGALAGPAESEVRIGRTVLAGMAYASPGFAGLCQFHFTPAAATAGAEEFRVCLGGECGDQRMALRVSGR